MSVTLPGDFRLDLITDRPALKLRYEQLAEQRIKEMDRHKTK
jgi:hypothetical protein